jgi:hypothetical protein
VRTVFIRQKGEGVLPRSLVHEVLHIYYPQLNEKDIEDADEVFETAFLCYDSLYHDQPQREFFLELCRSGDRLRKWAGLPKFDAIVYNEGAYLVRLTPCAELEADGDRVKMSWKRITVTKTLIKRYGGEFTCQRCGRELKEGEMAWSNKAARLTRKHYCSECYNFLWI